MTLALVLGVNDVPYNQGRPAPRRVRVRTRKGKQEASSAPASGQQTTGDVAGYLEEKYHVMQTFAERYMPEIGNALAHGMAGAIESLVAGAPASPQPLAGALAEIEEGFRVFLDQEELAGSPGVPTEAALKGINHRLKHPYAKANARRPSFIDTGLYEANLRAWVEE